MSRTGAGERLQRLLAIVPWIVQQDGPTLAEVCARFDCTEESLIADLDLVFLCGVHPFTPDTLMDVLIEDGRVWIRLADHFARPLRLTPEEALGLLAAGSAARSVPGADPSGPLARGLAKLAGVLGIDAGDTLDIALGSAPDGVLEALRSAVDSQHQVEIDYYAFGRDQLTRRVVDPYALYAVEGQWYLSGWCHLAQDERRFRADRVRSVVLLDRTFTPPRTAPEPTNFEAGRGGESVTLDLAPRARWVAEQYPLERHRELGDGYVRVTLSITGRAWLERLLLRLGPDATVVSGDPSVTAEAAKRVLSRYNATI